MIPVSGALWQAWPLHRQQQACPFPGAASRAAAGAEAPVSLQRTALFKPCCWMRYPMVTYTELGKHGCVLLREKQPASAVLGAAGCWSGPVSLLKEKGVAGLKSRRKVLLFPQAYAGALWEQPYSTQPWGLQSLRWDQWLHMCLRLKPQCLNLYIAVLVPL